MPELIYLGEYANAIKAQEYLSKNKDVDLLFLDIEMPGINGVEYLREIRPDVQVIFTTAYAQYAIDAFDLQVVDYLLKPIQLSRFIKAVNRAKELSAQMTQVEEITTQTDSVVIRADRQYIPLKYGDITYIQGMKDYVVIHTATKRYVTALNLATILRQLPNCIFARVSKSYIVNVDHMQSLGHDTIMIAGQEIPVGPSYKEKFVKDHLDDKLLKR